MRRAPRRCLLLAVASLGGGLALPTGAGEAAAAAPGGGEESVHGGGGDASCDAPSLLQPARAGFGARRAESSEASTCGDVRRRRRQSTCGCRRRVGVNDLNDPDSACIGDAISTIPRDADGFVNLTVMLEWVYQEPIIANLMNFPAAVCQDRSHVFFNCRVLQPNESMSIESSLPYYMYAVLGNETPGNWENLRDVTSLIGKMMGPVAILSAAFTGGASAAAYVAVQQVMTKQVTGVAANQIEKRIATEGVDSVAQNVSEELEEKVPAMLSGWSTLLGPGRKYLKIIGGLGGDVEQDSPSPTDLQIVEISKDEFAKLNVIAILPER
ncbi:unnamed protein product [Prorocentrum cordatum]|uniref:Uncharacterized protein n=1 Tax=Prorocentrum cordatum TaxID=2364126 RepID=A0ABN9VAE1_9DINO|nr:unnamed protein product [Polarella glacialis]